MDMQRTKETLGEFLDRSLQDMINAKLSLSEYQDALIEKGIFKDRLAIAMFLTEGIAGASKDFTTEFPIRYYLKNEEYENDESIVDDSDVEHMNEEFIKALEKTI